MGNCSKTLKKTNPDQFYPNLPTTLPPQQIYNLSISSSDLDTESTGSFFHDRCTSLGTLMGVSTTFPTITFCVPSQRRDGNRTPSVTRRRRNENVTDLVTQRRRKRLRRRRWWWLCSGHELKTSSLGEFLDIERRFGEEAVFDGETMTVSGGDGGGGMLFAHGRVLPPVVARDVACGGVEEEEDEDNDETTSVCSICRFSVSIAGICSGGSS